MENKEIVKVFMALANENRLLIFKEIIRAGESGICPCDISDKMLIPRNTLSFHLKSLEMVNLIKSIRRGKYLFYKLRVNQMKEVIEYLLKDCCYEEIINSQSCLREEK